MTASSPAPDGDIRALKRRFATLVAAEIVAGVLAMIALVCHFAFHLKGALAAFAGVVTIAAVAQVAFIFAFRRDMKKGA